MSTHAVTAHARYRFAAPADDVFSAWIVGNTLRQWFRPGPGDVTRTAIDAREGGAFIVAQRRGLDEIEHHGRYLEFARPTRLAFSWQVKDTPDASRVIVDIRASESGCELQLTHELPSYWAAYKEKVEASWMSMFAKLANTLNAPS